VPEIPTLSGVGASILALLVLGVGVALLARSRC
jgi:hypothetical protein